MVTLKKDPPAASDCETADYIQPFETSQSWEIAEKQVVFLSVVCGRDDSNLALHIPKKNPG